MNDTKIALVTVLLVIAGAASAQERRPLSDVMPLLKQRMASQCLDGRSQLASATAGHAREQAASMVRMACDCLPEELKRVEEDLGGGDENALITQQEFLSRTRKALTACAARIVRAEIGPRCEVESATSLGTLDKQAYCNCVSTGVARLDDEALAVSTSIAERNFRAKALARAQGASEPAAFPTPIDAIKDSCRKKGR